MKNNLEESLLKLFWYDELSTALKSEWEILFVKSFPQSGSRLASVWSKYYLNRGLFCLLFDDAGRLIGSYSGLVCSTSSGDIFLSCDTMVEPFKTANGTVKLARHIYEFLKTLDVKIVVGLPNRNVYLIRKRYLKWREWCKVCCYIGIPGISRIESAFSVQTWFVERPRSGWFLLNPLWISLQGRRELYKARGGIPLVKLFIGASRPGRFWIKIPILFWRPIPLCYKILTSETVSIEELDQLLSYVDTNCFDIP